MRFFAVFFLVFWLGIGNWLGVAKAQTSLNPNFSPFPRASQHDFSSLVPAPAGEKGFLRVKGNQFFWADGTRAKFWGINVANTSLFVPDAQIEAMLRNFRAAGFNLVRLHHFDERGGILDLNAPTSGQFLPERLRKIDFWIAKARENGISVYLDLLDYRRFKDGEGVANAEAIGRSAKPYAVFDERLIALQKEYARKLLREHKNEFTGKSYADDPTIVMLEIYSESGLFMRRGLWRSMPQPYATRFKALWNSWLLRTYGTTEKLRAAWTGPNGKSALFERESLATGSVELPAMTWETQRLREADLPFAALARRNDGARFAAQIHQNYFAQMRDFLRTEVGFRAPLCVTGRYDDLADIASQAAQLDFIGCNFYYDHPYWATGAPQWKLPSFFHGKNPISDSGEMGIAANLALARVKNKPFVVREWNYCWPNPHRAAGILEAATFASLQDFDAMILFSYGTSESARIGYFEVRNDPVRWGMAALGAQIFLEKMVAPAKNSVVVPYSQVDLFSYEKYHQPLYNLAWTSRISNDFFAGSHYTAPPQTSLLVPPGRSLYASYSGAPFLAYTRLNRIDLAGNSKAEAGAVADLSILARQNEIPDAPKRRSGLMNLQREEVAGAALDALRRFHDLRGEPANLARGIAVSDTAQITRNARGARLTVKTPFLQIYAGNLQGVGGTRDGLGVRNARAGALVAMSLDGLPLAKSRRWIVKMANDARNTGELMQRDPRFAQAKNGQWMVEGMGRAPVVSGGQNEEIPIEISLGAKPVLRVWSAGAAWELYFDGQKMRFWSDLAGSKFALAGENPQTIGKF